jgi:HEPN domain-containing protein
MQNGNHGGPHVGDEDDLQQLLEAGVSLHDTQAQTAQSAFLADNDEEDAEEVPPDSDVQGALGLYAEAAQDMATASLELSLGRHFACVDYCNQVAEKAAQAVSLLRSGRRSRYDHDLRALGALVGAPEDIQVEMERLTPFHPEAFYAETPPEEADNVISAEQASSYVQSARTILRWARNVVLSV